MVPTVGRRGVEDDVVDAFSGVVVLDSVAKFCCTTLMVWMLRDLLAGSRDVVICALPAVAARISPL